MSREDNGLRKKTTSCLPTLHNMALAIGASYPRMLVLGHCLAIFFSNVVFLKRFLVNVMFINRPSKMW